MSIEPVNPWTNPDAGDEDSDNDALSTLRRAGRASQADSTSVGSETDESRPHTDPLDWSTALPLGVLGGIDPESPGDADTVAVMEGLTQLRCGEAFLGWARYQSIGVLYDRLVVARAESDGLIVDGFADAAARISGIFAVSRPQAERMLDDAIVLRDDPPQVFGCLRDGIISIEQARLVISRTDLVRGPGTPPEVVAAVDEQIATTLRTRRGSWKRPRLRDMVDRIVFRQDPDAVRERRERALDRRGVFVDNCGDGVGEITAVMSAENVQIAVAAVRRLADAVCNGDGRTRQQRASDAMFALLSGSRFECACASTDCTAQIPEPGTVPPADPRFVIHVVCNEAALMAARRNARVVEMQDFEKAKDNILMGPERKSMVMPEEERRNTAYHESGHALIGKLLPKCDPVHKVTIIPRGRALGVTMSLPAQDRYSYDSEFMLNQISMLFGGRIAEEVFMKQMTTGASNDFERASQIARDMVMRYGMSEALGPMVYADNEGEVFLGRSVTKTTNMSEQTMQKIDGEVRRIIDEQYALARKLIEDNADKMHAMAKALLEWETIDSDQLDDIMAGREPRPPKDWTPRIPPASGGGGSGGAVATDPAPSAA